MRANIIYYTTMENSPEVTIVGITPSKEKARGMYRKALKAAKEWEADADSDCGDWAEARMRREDLPAHVGPGDPVFAVVETEWYEGITTIVKLFASEEDAKRYIAEEKPKLLQEYIELEPFDEDETFEESMHLSDNSVMVDYYFSIEKIIVE